MIDIDPIRGNWYRHQDKGQLFVVVALDPDAGLVEIQHFDGDLEEIDLDTWYLMDIELAEPPEDWTGPMDDVETDDLGYTETQMRGEDWAAPLKEIPSGKESWQYSSSPDEQDEWGEGQMEEELVEPMRLEGGL